jgi:four helix bundle protein
LKKDAMKNYRDLIIWQKSIELVVKLYRLTEQFPKSEFFGIVTQIRRCAVSIPSNVAEGFGRRSEKEFIRFLQIAMGSIFELQTQIIISVKLNFICQETYKTVHSDTRELEIILKTLIDKLKTNQNLSAKRLRN